MSIKLGVVMDPIEAIHYKKDTTLAMLWEAAHRGWEIFYFELKDLFVRDGKAFGHAKPLAVFKDPDRWFEFGKEKTLPLSELNVMLMRKDPPVDANYLYATQVLDFAEREGVFVVNKPQALRDFNEKIFSLWFKDCTPPTLVSQTLADLKAFLKEHKEIVCKPLHAMGGESIFCLRDSDKNAAVIFETLTRQETQFAMAQKYISEIKMGDKRIILIDGEPIPFALARIPAPEDFRGNLAKGAKGVAQPLSERDQWICKKIGPYLKEKGLIFVGIDVIGDYLIEVNVTSPTCVREIDEQCHLNISSLFFDCIVKKIQVS